jgi:chromate reductase
MIQGLPSMAVRRPSDPIAGLKIGTEDKFLKIIEARGERKMADKISILGFAGSLRERSFNKAILQAAVEMVPKGMEIEIFDLEGIPPFNQDVEKEPPIKIKEFKTKIRAADGILIATPEYNYSIPGVLKNAIDWASRPYGDNAFKDKPVGVMGASVGMLGTARAQYHLRQSFVFLNMIPMNQPEVMVAFAEEKVDSNGRLTDLPTRGMIKQFLEALDSWVRKFKRN